MSNAAEETSQNLPEEKPKHWSVAAAAFTAAVSLASGLFGGWAGSTLTVNASKEAEQRTRVGVVYAAYLDAANGYNNALNAWARARDDASADAAGDLVVETTWDAFLKAKFDYKGAINDVYVYGSEEAWKEHQNVAAVFEGTLQREVIRTLEVPDEMAFIGAHNGFLNVFCREAVATPREGCYRSTVVQRQ